MKKILAIAALALAAGCTAPKPATTLDLTALSSFKVQVTSGQMGTQQSPLPFSLAGQNYTLSITAIDGHGQTKTDFNGPVTISAVPGAISGAGSPTLSNGQATVSLTLSKAYGSTRIWVEDPKTYSTGVTDTIWYRGPKLADVQTSPTTTNSIFNGQRVQIDTASNLVVTAIHVDGFYVTDVDVANEAWASIFCYTFSTPAVNVGDKITGLVGTVSEFLGFTELNDPTWTIAGTGTPPTPVALDCSRISNSDQLQMEQLESGLVSVANPTVQVCPTYPSCPDYSQYKQWTISLGTCLLNVTSNYSLIGFDPTQNVGKPFTKMVGTLRQVEFATPQWILEPRGQTDVCCPSCTPALTQGC